VNITDQPKKRPQNAEVAHRPDGKHAGRTTHAEAKVLGGARNPG